MFKDFDCITRFRASNSLLVVFGVNLIIPIVMQLKGELLSAEVISLFMIGATLAVKMNRYLVKLSVSFVYKLGVVFHLLLTLSTFIYFYEPLHFVVFYSILGIIEVAVFTSFSIQLDQYLAKTNPDVFSKFRVFLNSKNADVIVLSLAITTLLIYLTNIKTVFIIFALYNAFFSARLVYNWNFFNRNLSLN